MEDIKKHLSNPDFQSLPDAEKLKVWASLDQDFAGLPSVEQMKVLRSTSGPQDLPPSSKATSGAMGRLLSGFGAGLNPMDKTPEPTTPGAEFLRKGVEFAQKYGGGRPEMALTGMLGDVLENITGRAEKGDLAGAAGYGAAQVTPLGLALGAEKAGVTGAIGKRQVGLAEKSYYKALNPTKEGMKFLTEKKVVPEMLKRKTWGGLPALTGKAKEGARIALEEMDAIWKLIPDQKSVKTRPLVQSMNKVIKEFQVAGVQKTRISLGNIQGPIVSKKSIIEPAPEVTRNLRAVRDAIRDLGDNSSPQTLRKVRQIWDAEVARAGGYMGKNISDASILYARKEGANAIRSEIAKLSPDLAKVNAEYTLWKRLGDVVESTSMRKVGQATPLTEQLLTGGGLAGGIAHGGLLKGGAVGLALKEGAKFVRSPAWKTFNAVTRQRIADAIAGGMIKDASIIFTLAIQSKKNEEPK